MESSCKCLAYLVDLPSVLETVLSRFSWLRRRCNMCGLYPLYIYQGVSHFTETKYVYVVLYLVDLNRKYGLNHCIIENCSFKLGS